MEPVASHWEKNEKLGQALIDGLRDNGTKIYSRGSMDIDLTQTSYSTIPSVDIELGDKESPHDEDACDTYAEGLLAGINQYYGFE